MPPRMYSLRIERRVLKELRRYPPKIFKQVASRVLALSANPRPHDSVKIGTGLRVDTGEYRIIYTVHNEAEVVTIWAVGPRNDDEIYKMARRMGLL